MFGTALHFAPLFRHYGLGAVFLVLLLENFGLPLPGEIALVLAGSQTPLLGHLGYLKLALAAIPACVLGQAIGYQLGSQAAGPVTRLFHLDANRQRRIATYFDRYGAGTIFAARFVAGLRVLAGPAAGLYHMPWRRFMAANVGGAAVWVLAVAGVGRLMGTHWRQMLPWLRRFDLLLLVALVAGMVWVWRRMERNANDSPNEQS